jgi:hypothetical protein
MPFQYSCFVSYRHHGQSELAERIIDDLEKALRNELPFLVEEGIYLDRNRLKGGDFYNEELQEALCRSVCMIIVFTPTYFSKKHPYCAREFKAMELLEQQRLAKLAEPERKQGLIIPIVFRGAEDLPQEIKGKRQIYNFEKFLLYDVEMSKHPEYASRIKEIAETIAKRKKALEATRVEFCSDCNTFKFPSENDILLWLDSLAESINPFPLRP